LNDEKKSDAVGHKRPRNETIVFRDGKPRMSTKKRKNTAAAKRKRTHLHEASKTKLAVQDAPLEGGKFWTWQLEPREIISVAGNLPKCILVIRNHGPDPVGVYAGYGDQEDLMPDGILMTFAYSKITIEDKGYKSALVEMEVMPTSL
jgi:hypothetical protein